MRFEWDENKRQANIEKHALDFLDALDAFDGRPVWSVPATRKDEERFITVTMIEGRFCAVIWCWRHENIRIISFRRARNDEERKYKNLHTG